VKFAAIAFALLSLGACSKGATMAPVAAPTIQYRNNPENVPGYVSPCAGGQPGMQYNCPQFRN
jgi:hypothetical protein